MLSQHEVVPYLLARGLLTSQSVVEGDLIVDDVSRRNHNFLVASPSGRYLLKQAAGPERVQTISREVAFYKAVSEKENGFSRYLPKFYLYDEERHILIIESLENAETLREQQMRTGRSSSRVAEELAEALAALHQIDAGSASEFVSARSLKVRLPHRPDLDIFGSISGGGIEVIKLIQEDRNLADVLDQLTGEPEGSSVIHGDVRGDNFLLPAKALARRERWLKIIDFELITLGDPAVDIRLDVRRLSESMDILSSTDRRLSPRSLRCNRAMAASEGPAAHALLLAPIRFLHETGSVAVGPISIARR